MNNFFTKPRPPLTRTRGWLAVIIAIIADLLQLPAQVLPIAPEVIDVLALIATTLLLGFHFLLLPTFLLEFIPVIDLAPTWTGCVLAVIALRKKSTNDKSPSNIDQKKLPPP